ncbi:hypothetical protein B0A48_05873 [Cryoendolithus antarcticus]|uniref:FAS1 domain-containing protein n=1 Tax=Cryoendolithus antarcticus TaxID=1507870 RepID=A0A1V8TC74_9PEZI|nr:hypothetical protein B0A48_05873 [Cryoendolithus antarcticus]
MRYTTLTLALFGASLAAAQSETNDPSTLTALSIHNSFTQITLTDRTLTSSLVPTDTATDTAGGFTVQTSTPTPSPSTSSPSRTSAPAAGTSIAVFTIPNAGVYTASLIASLANIAGYANLAPGQSALVGGQEVQIATNGVVVNGITQPFELVTGSSTVAVTSTQASSGGSAGATVTGSSTVAVAASTGSSAAAGSASATAVGSSSSAGAAATGMAKSPIAALGGIAGLLCLLG